MPPESKERVASWARQAASGSPPRSVSSAAGAATASPKDSARNPNRKEKSKSRALRRSMLSSSSTDDVDIEVLPGIRKSEFLDQVTVQVSVLMQRLELEMKMDEMTVKLPAFCIAVLSFIVALFLLSPTDHLASASSAIISHYGLANSRLGAITSPEHLYEFINDFQHRNDELQATSWKYWCEERYFDIEWNAELGLPVRKCDSPRLNALGHIGTAESDWEQVGAVPAPGGDPAACVDQDDLLMTRAPHYTAGCSSNPMEICGGELGLILCQKTCGFCPHWQYQRLKAFPMTQVSVMPSVIFQTRAKTKDCGSDFLAAYEQQGFNPTVIVLPASDGPRHGPLYPCVDYQSTFDEEYSHMVPCPDGSPSGACPDGFLRVSKRHTFRGTSVYPWILLDPHIDLGRMMAMEWIDVQTIALQVSTLVYTQQPIDLYTSVSVVFRIDASGNIIAKRTISSYKDISGLRAWCFFLLLTLATVLNVASLWRTMGKRGISSAHFKRTAWTTIYEYTCRAFMCIYFVILIIISFAGGKIETEFKGLIDLLSSISNQGSNSIEVVFEQVIAHFFQSMDAVSEKMEQLHVIRLVCFGLCYALFVQLMLYFAAHPRIAVITSTISKAYDHIFHAMFVLTLCSVSLGTIVYWFFGDSVHLFSTPTKTFLAQSRLLFGQWIEETDGSSSASENLEVFGYLCFWAYIGTFMTLVFYMLLNLFLAIIVNAFFEVKKEVEEDDTEGNFLVDAYDVFSSRAAYKYWGWHDKKKIMQQLRSKCAPAMADTSPDGGPASVSDDAVFQEARWDETAIACRGRDFMGEYPDIVGNENQLIAFLVYYHGKCSSILEFAAQNNNNRHSRSADFAKMDGRGSHCHERETKALLSKVAYAKQIIALRHEEYLVRAEKERAAIQAAWDRVAEEREALSQFLKERDAHRQAVHHRSIREDVRARNLSKE